MNFETDRTRMWHGEDARLFLCLLDGRWQDERGTVTADWPRRTSRPRLSFLSGSSSFLHAPPPPD